MSSTIAIDPSGKLLHAVYPVLDRLCFVQVPTNPLNLDLWFRLMRWLQFTEVVYEDCYLSKNTKTYASLVSLRNRVEEAARKNKINFLAVPASKWQNALLISDNEKRVDTMRDVRKLRAYKLATYILDREPPTQDIADAVCLWYYHCTEFPVTFESCCFAERHTAGAVAGKSHQVPHNAPPQHSTPRLQTKKKRTNGK